MKEHPPSSTFFEIFFLSNRDTGFSDQFLSGQDTRIAIFLGPKNRNNSLQGSPSPQKKQPNSGKSLDNRAPTDIHSHRSRDLIISLGFFTGEKNKRVTFEGTCQTCSNDSNQKKINQILLGTGFSQCFDEAFPKIGTIYPSVHRSKKNTAPAVGRTPEKPTLFEKMFFASEGQATKEQEQTGNEPCNGSSKTCQEIQGRTTCTGILHHLEKVSSPVERTEGLGTFG